MIRATAPTAARDARATADVLLLLGLGALVIGAGLGLRDPWAPDEPRFALIARDMLASGDWLFPSRGGELYADKPPLYFWISAAALWLIHSPRVAFLVPSLLAGLITLWLVSDLGRRLWDTHTGLVAGLLLLVTVQFTQHARAAHIDALLCMWTTLSLYALLRHLLLGPAWGWYTVAWLAAGFGIITKGVGFLGLFALLPYAFARARGWSGIVRGGGWRWFACAGTLLVAVALWLGPMLLAVHASGAPELATYRDDILLRQTVDRYAGDLGHVHAWWYFLVAVIPWAWLPVTALLPWLVPVWRRELMARDTRTLVLLGTVAAIVLFFTLSPGKRGVYVLPALPALVLAAAPHVTALLERRAVQFTGFALTALVALLLSAVGLYLRFAGTEGFPALSAGYDVVPVAVAFDFAVLAGAWLAIRPQHGALAFGGMLLSFWLAAGWWLEPRLNAVRSSKALMTAVDAAIAPGEELAIVRYREEFLLQARRPVTHFGYRRADTEGELHDAIAWLSAAPDRRLLVDDEVLHRCFRTDGPRPIGFASDRRWYLARAADADGSCAKDGSPDNAVAYRIPRD